jgi:hypothetical protein
MSVVAPIATKLLQYRDCSLCAINSAHIKRKDYYKNLFHLLLIYMVYFDRKDNSKQRSANALLEGVREARLWRTQDDLAIDGEVIL